VNLRRVSVALVAVLSGVGALVLQTSGPADALRSGINRKASSYYVAVGASESVGYQPTLANPHGEHTDMGYANDLAGAEAVRWPGLSLIEIGCPGITAEAALDGTAKNAASESIAGKTVHCNYPAGSEVATAVRIIRQRADRTVLVTVDLGFNDVAPCLRHETVDSACVTLGLAEINQALPEVLSRLRSAGGSHMLIVGLEHSDPYLATSLRGEPAFAHESQQVIDRLNGELAAIYTSKGALVANVPAAYGTSNTTPTTLVGHGSVPEGIARDCALTWMCGSLHNLHPTDAGYRAIAAAIGAAIADATATAGSDATAPTLHS